MAFVSSFNNLCFLANCMGGIDMAQGYAIARPVPIEQILDEADARKA